MRGAVIWFTGLSGAGKTTIARGVAERLRAAGVAVEVLDGDAVRPHLSEGLGFTKADRDTHVARVGYVASRLATHGVVVLASLVSPYREARDAVRRVVEATGARFAEVFVDASVEVCARRDVKGLYARAVRGEIPHFTGVSDPYEAPLAPELVLATDIQGVDESVGRVVAHIEGTLCGLPHAHASLGIPLGIPPHGGALVDRVLHDDAAALARERAERLPSITLSPVELADLEMIATGAWSPLTGFLGEADYTAVLEAMRLASGLPWALPITLRIPPETRLGDEVALRDATGAVRGLLEVGGVFTACTDREARVVYGTADRAHPGVARLLAASDRVVHGNVWLVSRAESAFPELALDPVETRRVFAERGWRTVVGFQTRNPVHRAHEYIQKATLETVDGLLLHPLVGATKGDDVPAEVRVRSYRALLNAYYPRDRVLLAAFPAAMRYAGPREAVCHAIARQNYGCTHFIVGRDHAGVGSFYGPSDAQAIFERFAPGELGITPVRFEHTFYCRRCAGMASRKTCPHGAEHQVILSGSRVRELLRAGELPPPEFSRPEVAAILSEAYAVAAVREGEAV